jgi:5-(carboxyamino)imidazole ribonucleotide synthase
MAQAKQCSHILPPAWLGVLGGGQLGRMFAMAAHRLGYRVMVLTPEADSPASQVADHTIVAPYDDPQALRQLAERCQAITLEFENLPLLALNTLQTLCKPVRPNAAILGIAQHRLTEKSTLAQLGLPVTPFAPIHSRADLPVAWNTITATGASKAVIKTAGFGYDGKGQVKVDSLEALQAAYEAFSTNAEGQSAAYIVEAWVPFQQELSVIAGRNANGDFAHYGAIGNQHANHILDVSIWPAPLPEALAQQAVGITQQIMNYFSVEGLLCVEFFVLPPDANGVAHLLINEMAPRAHNSGHLTIEGFTISQFELQVRCLCNLPLGGNTITGLLQPTVTDGVVGMVNLLGQHLGNTPNWSALLRHYPNVSLHLYGKTETREGRKMGHITALDQSIRTMSQHLLQARTTINPIH